MTLEEAAYIVAPDAPVRIKAAAALNEALRFAEKVQSADITYADEDAIIDHMAVLAHALREVQ